MPHTSHTSQVPCDCPFVDQSKSKPYFHISVTRRSITISMITFRFNQMLFLNLNPPLDAVNHRLLCSRSSTVAESLYHGGVQIHFCIQNYNFGYFVA